MESRTSKPSPHLDSGLDEAWPKGSKILPERGEKTPKARRRRRDNEHTAENQDIGREDDGEREDAPVLLHIGLFPQNHPDREAEVEHPGEADQGIEPDEIGVEVIGGDPVEKDPDGHRDNGVERKEIGRERDQEVGPVGDDVPAGVGDLDRLEESSAKEPHEESVRPLMPRHVKVEHRPTPREKEKHQPESAPETKKSKLARAPVGGGQGVGLEQDHKGLKEDPTERDEGESDQKLDPQDDRGMRIGKNCPGPLGEKGGETLGRLGIPPSCSVAGLRFAGQGMRSR